MKFTFDWLKEHLDTNASILEIINALERMGLPCENNVFAHPSWHIISIAKIIAKEAHPNADKLNLYTIEFIETETKEIVQRKIVCGDGSLEIGNCVPYAQPGTVIPKTNTAIKLSAIRGIESPGMLCSAQELELPIPNTGVLKCDFSDFGKTIAQAFESTAIIEVEVTPNRGDILSIRGIAKNLAFQNLGTLKPLEIEPCQVENSSQKLVTIDESSFCENQCMGIHVARINYSANATNAKIAKRLALVDINPTGIDLIDATNYVAHEIGQPMHAFDFAKLSHENTNSPILNVENLPEPTAYTALNGIEMILEKGTLVIKDQAQIVSWPGVIGGDGSKITTSSKEILLETGIFKIDSIQRRKHKIYTMSSKRFEYGVDIDNLGNAIGRFCFLLGAKPIAYEKIELKPKKEIKFELKTLTKILGYKPLNLPYNIDSIFDLLQPAANENEAMAANENISYVETDSHSHKYETHLEIHQFPLENDENSMWTIQDLKEKLQPRGFIFKNETKTDCVIEIPSYKFFDIKTQNCIVEEFAIGDYENIESENLVPKSYPNWKEKSKADTLIEVACENGFNECVHFSITNLENAKFQLDQNKRSISNASNNNYSILRGTMIPQLLKTASWHKNNCYDFCKFFEHGLIYGDFSNETDERKETNANQLKKNSADTLDLNSLLDLRLNDFSTQKTIFTAIAPEHESLLKILYTFLEKANLDSNITMENSAFAWHDGGKKIYINHAQKNEKILIGTIGKIAREITKEFDLKTYFALEIFTENIEHNCKKKKVKKPMTQMPIYKDVSFKIPADFEIGKLTSFLKGRGYVFTIFDIYPTKNLQEQKNLGLRFMFEENSQITTDELNAKIEKITIIVKKEFEVTAQ